VSSGAANAADGEYVQSAAAECLQSAAAKSL
jgi:hypothetical protein